MPALTVRATFFRVSSPRVPDLMGALPSSRSRRRRPIRHPSLSRRAGARGRGRSNRSSEAPREAAVAAAAGSDSEAPREAGSEEGRAGPLEWRG